MFSPWYAWSGRRDPENHVCINVATYGRGGRFTMTDRGRAALRQSAQRFQVGPSAVNWNGSELVIEVNEVAAPPLPGRVQGTIRLTPEAVTAVEMPLTPDGAHVWRPFAPVSRIEVNMEAAGWQWRGHGYFDANFGTRALEADFSRWTWGRYPTADGALATYDAVRRDGSELATAARFDASGGAGIVAPPPRQELSRTLWGIPRQARGDEGARPRQVKTMLDAPFYSRSMVETVLDGETTVGVHEALDLNRFRSPWLKPMIALRVPRRRNWEFGD
ncbi:hydroxyneurosporene dehydrogenase [Roseivivax halodurans JCM 10272]|uniref:Hydroxyneurosporene dehydrogenase n=1 Tax=Roseivivax halodurans JCM 10272 TaxID=1449350 RepID=X7EIU3_9RHOB|nr:hydroxyneurosporene dehydrogenase [Roseivivax halodurans JCM 10272]